MTVTAVLFVSSDQSRITCHLQLVKYSRSMHASGVAQRGRRSLRKFVEEEKTKKKGGPCAPLQWKHLTHGWLFIIANYSVVLSGSRWSITHQVRRDRDGVRLLILSDAVLQKQNGLHHVTTPMAFWFYCHLLHCSASHGRTGWRDWGRRTGWGQRGVTSPM